MLNEEEYLRMDATEIAGHIKAENLQEKEVFQAFEESLSRKNPALNAVVRTRKEAVKEDRRYPEGVFAGVPFLTKDISQAVAGELLTAGSSLLNNTAAQDSYLVKKFRGAGLRIAGQTNTPEFGLKNITESVRYGPCRNPHNTAYSAGGSSGGAAAATAAGIVPMAGASDGGGSIRIPASFTGLVGLKPTRGRTPTGPGSGRQWQGAAIDFAVTRTVRDCAMLLQEVQTFQKEAAFPFPKVPEKDFEVLKQAMPKRKIAFSTLSPAGTKVSAAAQAAVMNTVRLLEKDGHEVTEIIPEIDGAELMRQYYIMNSGEMAAVAAQLEIALQRNITDKDLELESWMLFQAGTHVSAAQYSQSLQAWDQAAAVMHEFHQSYDIYITPATADGAPKVGELTYADIEAARFRERMLHAEEAYQQELIYEMFLPSLTYTPFTQLANLTGQPAVSLPLGETEQQMPIGVQAMAAKGEEMKLLQLAASLESSRLWKQTTIK